MFYPPADPTVREEAQVVVDGQKETWRLVWREPPKLICNDTKDPRIGAPCSCWRFGFAEEGMMDLVRQRPASASYGGLEREERFSLNALLSEVMEGQDGVARIWVKRADSDPKDTRDVVPAAEVMKKPIVKLMNFADYDHDGWASEFVLTIPSYGATCGHYSEAVVVGVSKAKPYLHAFAVTLPDASDWESVRNAKAHEPVQVFDLRCGDHGNGEDELSRLVTWDAKGLHAQDKKQPCSAVDY